jgi:hypothetical protein
MAQLRAETAIKLPVFKKKRKKNPFFFFHSDG